MCGPNRNHTTSWGQFVLVFLLCLTDTEMFNHGQASASQSKSDVVSVIRRPQPSVQASQRLPFQIGENDESFAREMTRRSRTPPRGKAHLSSDADAEDYASRSASMLRPDERPKRRVVFSPRQLAVLRGWLLEHLQVRP